MSKMRIGDTDENDGEGRHPFCSLSSYIMHTHTLAPFCACLRVLGFSVRGGVELVG